jgi:hypothetical protein
MAYGFSKFLPVESPVVTMATLSYGKINMAGKLSWKFLTVF